jgi:hypothetical protein
VVQVFRSIGAAEANAQEISETFDQSDNTAIAAEATHRTGIRLQPDYFTTALLFSFASFFAVFSVAFFKMDCDLSFRHRGPLVITSQTQGENATTIPDMMT